MGTIRNIALAVAAGGLLAAGYAAAEESKPSTTPRAEQHRHGGQGMAGEGCIGGPQAQMGERHGRMGGMHGRMAERHARMGMQHGQAGECTGAGQGGCPAMQSDAEHQHGS